MIAVDLCEIPYHMNFYLDQRLDIHIFENDKEVKFVNRSEMKFEYKKRTYYTYELSNLILYGVRDVQNFTNHKILSDEFIAVNGIVFKKVNNKLPWYYVSTFGALYSIYSRRLRKREVDEDGYVRVSFSNGNKTHVGIHRIVYETWVGEIPDGMVVDHINNMKWDNYYTNLQLLSNEDNLRKAATDGLYYSTFRWNEETVRQVCDMMKDNMSVKDIASHFGIDAMNPKDRILYKNFRNQLYNFRMHQRSWKDITGLYNFDGYDGFILPTSKYRDSEILRMRKMYADGYSIKEIAKEYNTEPNHYFSRLVRGLKRRVIKLKLNGSTTIDQQAPEEKCLQACQ